jgi:hypothetical protein
MNPNTSEYFIVVAPPEYTEFQIKILEPEEDEIDFYRFQVNSLAEGQSWIKTIRDLRKVLEHERQEEYKKALQETKGKWTKPAVPPELLSLLQSEVAGKSVETRRLIPVGPRTSADDSQTNGVANRSTSATPPSASSKTLTMRQMAATASNSGTCYCARMREREREST